MGLDEAASRALVVAPSHRFASIVDIGSSMHSSSSVRFRVTGALSVLAVLLSGCASLPSSGPTGRQVVRGAQDPQAALRFQVVELDGAAFQKLLTVAPAGRGAGQIAALA